MTTRDKGLVELLPCPFCNYPNARLCSGDYQNDRQNPWAYVECEACESRGAYFDGGSRQVAEQAAITAWNRRPQRSLNVTDKLVPVAWECEKEREEWNAEGTAKTGGTYIQRRIVTDAEEARCLREDLGWSVHPLTREASAHLPADRVAEAFKAEFDLWKDANHRTYLESTLEAVVERIASLLPESQRAEFVRKAGGQP